MQPCGKGCLVSEGGQRVTARQGTCMCHVVVGHYEKKSGCFGLRAGGLCPSTPVSRWDSTGGWGMGSVLTWHPGQGGSGCDRVPTFFSASSVIGGSVPMGGFIPGAGVTCFSLLLTRLVLPQFREAWLPRGWGLSFSSP